MTDDPMPTPTCCGCLNPRPAQMRLRILPRRDVKPLTDAVRRALAWPGQAEPIWIATCGSKKCHDIVRSLAVSVLAAEALDTVSVVTRKVEA